MIYDIIDERLFIGLIGVFVFWLFILSFFLIRTIRHYQRLIGKTKKQDLKKLLEVILDKIKNQEEETGLINRRCDEIEKKNIKHLQKIGFLRFNPFSDTGGDQSFILSFLDGEENGIILSSLHGRGATRIYAKTVKKGEEGENFKFSKEEKEVIKKTLKRRL